MKTSPNVDTILTTHELNVFYDESAALKNVSLAFDRHKIHTIIGPSGCGKSTFIRTLNRMHELQKNVRITGSIILDGEDLLLQNPFEVRLKMGMVFQKPNPFPSFSIYDNVLAGYKIHGVRPGKTEADHIVEMALKKAALWSEVKDKLKKRSLFLSGGQQQRLCIARALAVEPEVLLLDEPTSALDPLSTGAIEELISELKNSVTIFLVTHNLSQAGRVSDTAAFFWLGELIENGPAAEFFLNPRQSKTQAYLEGRVG